MIRIYRYWAAPESRSIYRCIYYTYVPYSVVASRHKGHAKKSRRPGFLYFYKQDVFYCNGGEILAPLVFFFTRLASGYLFIWLVPVKSLVYVLCVRWETKNDNNPDRLPKKNFDKKNVFIVIRLNVRKMKSSDDGVKTKFCVVLGPLRRRREKHSNGITDSSVFVNR